MFFVSRFVNVLLLSSFFRSTVHMKTQARAVVVGGAGFIGGHLVEALIKEGWDVDVIDNLVSGKREHVPDPARLHVVDIRNYDDLFPIINGADHVFHLAALPRVQFSIDEPLETHSVNATGMLNVLFASKNGGVKRFVYSASSSAYGDQETLPLREDLRPAPVSPYGLQKYFGEEYARVFSEVYGLSTASLRYFNVYGSRLDPEGPYALVIGKFLKQKRDGLPLTITGDGEQTRDFTHVRDVVRANILAAQSDRVGRGEAINIGNGRNVSMNKLAELIGGRIEYIQARKEPRHTLADHSRAKALLGWEPTVSLEDGLVELKAEWGL